MGAREIPKGNLVGPERMEGLYAGGGVCTGNLTFDHGPRGCMDKGLGRVATSPLQMYKCDIAGVEAVCD
jgi:hypothetical protein